MKAFLSHSSLDKKFVDEVAKCLGREYVLYDSYSFDHGEAFKEEIIRGLDKSRIFVFFISENSLKASHWIELELDEAQKRLLNNALAKSIAISLDENISFDRLPHWLRDINIPTYKSPSTAARFIKEHVEKLKREKNPALFIGRAKDIERIESALTPSGDHHHLPGMIVLWGLPGIGRRTLAKRIMRDIFDLQRQVSIYLEAGDSVADLRIKLADRFDRLVTEEDYKKLQTLAETTPVEKNIKECINYFETAQRSRELIVLVDHGGLLDEDGYIINDFVGLISAIFDTHSLRTIIVSRRKPMTHQLADGLELPSVRIDHISHEASRDLLQQLKAQEHLELTPAEISSIAEVVKGYPPAAYHAIGLIKDYGRELIVRSNHPIVSFREAAFLQLLKTENKFTEIQRSILNILSQFDALPLPILGHVLNAEQELIDSESMRLIDLALLCIDEHGFYSVSDPLQESVHKVFSSLAIPYDKIANAIDEYLSTQSNENSLSLALLRARVKAYVLSGRTRDKLFYIASDLIGIQQRLYHDREYKRSIDIGKQVLEIRPEHLEAQKFLARAYIQIEDSENAHGIIRKIKNLKEAKFALGFLFRKQNKIPDAIAAYKEAVAHGMKGAAIHRELGQCYFEIGDLRNAREHLAIAKKIDPENKYVLDYHILVSIAENQFPEAQEGLRLLAQVENPMRVNHRLSTLEYARGNFPEAYAAAASAFRGTAKPHFEVIAQYIKSAIKATKLDEALDGLRMLSKNYPNIRFDIQNGLWARFYLASGRIADAETYWNKIKKKESVIHTRIYVDILKAKLADHSTSPSKKEDIKIEVAKLATVITKNWIDVLDVDIG